MLHDIVESIRGLTRRPAYAAVTIATLAIGLTAAIAVFTYVNSYFQPFPGVHAEGLVRVFATDDEDPNQDISYLDYLDYRDHADGFERLAASQPYYAASVRLETMTEVAFLEAVSGTYFGTLDVAMHLGRGIGPEDDRPEATPAAVISYRWWQRTFGGLASVIGSTVYLNYRPYVVVGVADPAFSGSTSDARPDVWVPFAPFRDRYTSWDMQAKNRDVSLVRVFGRVRDDTDRAHAQEALQLVAAGLDATYPRVESVRTIRVDDLTWIDPRTRRAEMPTVRIMLMAAGGLLLLVVANVGNILLAMTATRQRELAVRAAIGASPGRLARGVLVENVLLATVAAGVAIALARPLSARLGSYFSRPSIWGETVARVPPIDLRVVGVAFGVAVVTGLVAGMFPALRTSRRDLLTTLKSGTDGATGDPGRGWGGRAPGLHDVLVSLQVALSVLLLVVAGLVLRTLSVAGDIDPGFAYQTLVASHVSTSSTNVEVQDRERWFTRLTAELEQEPWVRTATFADNALLSGHGSVEFRLDGVDEPSRIVYSRVPPTFFDKVGIPILEGRDFAVADTAGAPAVAVVTELLQDRFFGGRALGKRLWWPGTDGTEREFEIVGVVANVKLRDFLAEHEPTVFLSYAQQEYPSGSALHVNTSIEPAAAVPLLNQWLRTFEPHTAIINVLPYTEVVRGFLYAHRMNAELFSVLAVLGITLSAVGIFTVVSLGVTRRTREIGIRMAIGARGSDVGRLVLRRALPPVVVGLVGGLVATAPVAALMRSMLYGVTPGDPVTLAVGAGGLLLVALVAVWVPARRATGLDPVLVLREE